MIVIGAEKVKPESENTNIHDENEYETANNALKHGKKTKKTRKINEDLKGE